MRIVLANKFYYRRGGDCVHMLDLEQLLKAHGHEVAVFAMDYPENLETPWSKYFPSEVKFEPGMGMIEALMRPFGTREVRRKFSALLNDFYPDVVHLNNIHSQLSPVIAELAHERGMKVVWTIHDYKLLCPRYDCLKNGKEICEECFKDKKNVLKYRCMKNSSAASLLSYWEAKKWHKSRLEDCTDAFVCPSAFMARKMSQGGFCKDKLHSICNFINVERCYCDSYENRGDYYCFIGRLSHEKGTGTLIEAANMLPQYKLVVIGGGSLEKELKTIAGNHIRFVGFKQWDEIKQLVGKARFSVIPSEWYENNPISVIEAGSLGTPVLGADIGGIPELISEETGKVFKSRNIDDLKEKIKAMYATCFDYSAIAEASQKRYNAEIYYEKIMKIYAEM
jgi:glycosyltransferase involved in cell wall biosynthesis